MFSTSAGNNSSPLPRGTRPGSRWLLENEIDGRRQLANVANDDIENPVEDPDLDWEFAEPPGDLLSGFESVSDPVLDAFDEEPDELELNSFLSPFDDDEADPS